jgi:sulfite reductase (ferredoxin)
MNMESFRTEIEDPIVQKEIVDLERKLLYSKKARLMTSVFVRLARGVYDSAKKAFK